MPQTNNIAVSTGASLTYFILSFVTLALMFCTYEIVNYGQRSLMMYWRVISALYGLALIILGIILLIMELASMSDTCTTIWGTLSQNQKIFFKDNKSNLEAERSKNVSMMGAFAIVVGFFVIVSGVTQHLLYSESAIISKPPSTSRLPPSDKHEKMNFVYEY